MQTLGIAIDRPVPGGDYFVSGFRFRVKDKSLEVQLIRHTVIRDGVRRVFWKPGGGTNVELKELPLTRLKEEIKSEVLESGTLVLTPQDKKDPDSWARLVHVTSQPAERGRGRHYQLFCLAFFEGTDRTSPIKESGEEEYLEPPEWVELRKAMGRIINSHRTGLSMAAKEYIKILKANDYDGYRQAENLEVLYSKIFS